MIEEIIEKNPAYGYPSIKVALEKKYGEIVNHKLLLKLLKLWGLSLKRKVRRPKRSWICNILDFLEKRANLLWRRIRENKITQCFQVIISDVTEIYYSGNKAYLSVHMDYFGKLIYGWKLKKSPDKELVIGSFKMAIRWLKGFGINSFKKIIIHQDRGSVYTSIDYTAEVLSYDFHLSYSRTGEPGDNAVNESFFSRLKEEWRDIFEEAKDFEELCRLVRKAINYYNKSRYHSSIGYETPLSFVKSQVKLLTQYPVEAVC